MVNKISFLPTLRRILTFLAHLQHNSFKPFYPAVDTFINIHGIQTGTNLTSFMILIWLILPIIFICKIVRMNSKLSLALIWVCVDMTEIRNASKECRTKSSFKAFVKMRTPCQCCPYRFDCKSTLVTLIDSIKENHFFKGSRDISLAFYCSRAIL